MTLARRLKKQRKNKRRLLKKSLRVLFQRVYLSRMLKKVIDKGHRLASQRMTLKSYPSQMEENKKRIRSQKKSKVNHKLLLIMMDSLKAF